VLRKPDLDKDIATCNNTVANYKQDIATCALANQMQDIAFEITNSLTV
jgi:hypothetical protein